jgi:AIPR protein
MSGGDDGVDKFARGFAAEIAEAGSPYESEEFTRLTLERLADEAVFENPILLMQEGSFGRGRYSISGYSMSDEEDRLTLFATLYSGALPPSAVTAGDLKQAAELAARFLWYSAQGLHEKIEPANTDASDLARRLFDLSATARISHLKVVVITDGRVEGREVELTDREGTRVEVELFGIERLHRILGEGVSREDIVVDVAEMGIGPLACLDCGYEGDYRAYLAVVPGALLAAAYERYGTRLLELNVRAFLGLRGRKSVNAGLRTTLRDEPQHFLAYNNGIVATVDAIDLTRASDGSLSVLRLKGLQIVNGGQTTASIHRAVKIDRMDVSNVRVPAKIIRVEQDDLSRMVAAISRSANSQNTVQPADFSANDPFHVAVESLAANAWLPGEGGRWFYERARGSYGAADAKAALKASDRQRFKRETPKERRFSKTDLAKFLNTWEGYPHQVSFGGQKNFQFFMQRLKERHPDGFMPDEAWFHRLVAVAVMHRSLTKVVRSIGFSAYQANIVTYVLAWLGWATGGRIDFELMWRSQTVSGELSTLFDHWARAADQVLRSSAGSRMPTEWAKKDECWDAFKAALPALPEPLPPELAQQGGTRASSSQATSSGPVLTHDELMLISRAREIDATKWLQIAAWGRRNRNTYKLAGIASTIAEYAADAWSRSPSVKQAKWGLELARMHEEAGAD